MLLYHRNGLLELKNFSNIIQFLLGIVILNVILTLSARRQKKSTPKGGRTLCKYWIGVESIILKLKLIQKERMLPCKKRMLPNFFK